MSAGLARLTICSEGYEALLQGLQQVVLSKDLLPAQCGREFCKGNCCSQSARPQNPWKPENRGLCLAFRRIRSRILVIKTDHLRERTCSGRHSTPEDVGGHDSRAAMSQGTTVCGFWRNGGHDSRAAMSHGRTVCGFWRNRGHLSRAAKMSGPPVAGCRAAQLVHQATQQRGGVHIAAGRPERNRFNTKNCDPLSIFN